MTPGSSGKPTSALPVAGLVLALLAGQFWLEGRLRGLDPAWVQPPVAQDYKWDPEVFRALTFGQVSSAVDWLWMRVLQDEGISHVQPGTHPRAYYDLDLATDLDPAFAELYLYGSNLLVVIRDDDEGAKELLLKGDAFRKTKLPAYSEEFRDRYWSQAWALSLSLAYVYLFELDDLPRAAVAFGEAAELPGAPAYLKSLKERLEKPGGQFEVGMRLLGHMIEGAQDERIKAGLERRRRDLFLAQYLHELNEEYRSSGRSWERFRAEKGLSGRDPFGGELRVGADGRLVTSTPYEPVFGLR